MLLGKNLNQPVTKKKKAQLAQCSLKLKKISTHIV